MLFIVDLIADPGQYIMRCAVHRRPVNPFSFMLFGGLLYNLITTSGLTITSFVNPSPAMADFTTWVDLLIKSFQENLPFSLIFFMLLLIYNIFPFVIFKYLSLKTRYFDDFMRLMAVVQGMIWMLISFLVLFGNQAWGVIKTFNAKQAEIKRA